ncbi:MAG TPA: hypothetical protein VJA16_08140, partial [Thermoanaerobaculia bacterium]
MPGHPQVPGTYRRRALPGGQRALPAAGEQAVHGIAPLQCGGRHGAGEEAAGPQPVQVHRRVGQALAGEQRLELGRGERLAEQAEAVEGRIALRGH